MPHAFMLNSLHIIIHLYQSILANKTRLIEETPSAVALILPRILVREDKHVESALRISRLATSTDIQKGFNLRLNSEKINGVFVDTSRETHFCP